MSGMARYLLIFKTADPLPKDQLRDVDRKLPDSPHIGITIPMATVLSRFINGRSKTVSKI